MSSHWEKNDITQEEAVAGGDVARQQVPQASNSDDAQVILSLKVGDVLEGIGSPVSPSSSAADEGDGLLSAENSPTHVRLHFATDGEDKSSREESAGVHPLVEAPDLFAESPDPNASPNSMVAAMSFPHSSRAHEEPQEFNDEDDAHKDEHEDVATALGGRSFGQASSAGALPLGPSLSAVDSDAASDSDVDSQADDSADEDGFESVLDMEAADDLASGGPKTHAEVDAAELEAARRLLASIRGAEGPSTAGNPTGDSQMEAFYIKSSAMTVAACLRMMNTRLSGLSLEASTVRARVFGPNRIESEGSTAWYLHLFNSFCHPFNLLLTALAVIAGVTGDMASVGLLLGMVLISVGISFVQERKAAISAKALKAKVTHKAMVRRHNTTARVSGPKGAGVPSTATSTHQPDISQSNQSDIELAALPSAAAVTKALAENGGGVARVVPASGPVVAGASGSGAFTVECVASWQLVPGDMVLLAAGSLVPADLRLLSCNGMLINQTILTGESLPVEKNSRPYRAPRGAQAQAPEAASEAHWLRRANLAFMGSSVECGSGVGVVLATGGLTYFGRNAAQLIVPRPPSAFNKGVKQVSYVLMGFTAVMLPTVIVINGARTGDWVEAALFGAAVAVGITPTMLPMVVQGNLSLAAHRLAQKKCLVKRLEAIQNMGAISVLCTDKTGTLTNDQVSLFGVVNNPTDPQTQLELTAAKDEAPIKEETPMLKTATSDDVLVVVEPVAAHSTAAGEIAAVDNTPTHNEWLLRGGPVVGVAYTIAKQQQGFRNVLDHAIVRAYEEAFHVETEEQANEKAAQAKPAKEAEAATTTKPHTDEHEDLPLAGVASVPDSVKLPAVWGLVDVELPFDFHRRRMSVIIQRADSPVPQHPANKTAAALYCKGALSETLACCTHVLAPSEDGLVKRVELDAMGLIRVRALGEKLAAQGLRVLAVAEKLNPVSVAAARWSVVDESGLTLVGLLTFLDQAKPSAAPALKRLDDLGVAVKVLTGDNPLVAKQVCKQLGMDADRMLTGDDMARLTHDDDDPVLQQLFFDTVLFAQLTPHDKARVVRCLRFRGEVLGFLGDGINDALALREADVGVSVDTGSELAKDAADVILTEKDLSVLGDAVETGRLTHANSIKYIKMAASGNFGNVFSLIFAAAWLPFLPIVALQLLLQNLLYDISQIAIPFDTMDAEFLARPKRWSGGNLAWFMMCIGPVSSVFDITTFMLAFYVYDLNDANDKKEVRTFQTMWFMVGLMTQTLIVHMIRTEKIPFIQSRPAPQLFCATVIVTVIGFIIPYIPPVADAIGMEPPHGSWFGFLAAIMAAYFGLVFIVKKAFIRITHSWL